MPDQPTSPQPEKPLSEQLRSIKDEYSDLAKRIKDSTSRLDKLIWDAETKERRVALDKTVDEFVPHNYEALKGHDVTFLIAKSKGMGEGYNSPIGAAIEGAFKVYVAVSGHDTGVFTVLWDTSTKDLRMDFDRMEKAREKTENTVKNLMPAVRDIMISNTPDKQRDRQKHYIIVCDGDVSDNIDHSVQMIEHAMQLNSKVTFDFINVGTGNLKDLAARVKAPAEAQKPGFYGVSKAEELNGTMMCVLAGRFTAKQEAPKVDTVQAEAPKAETPKPVPAATPKP